MTPLRARLYSPANAVVDHDISMRNGWPVKPHLEVVVAKKPPVIVWTKPKKKALSVVNNHPLTAGGAREDSPLAARFGMREIRIAVCEAWGISEYEMLASRRTREFVAPRQVAFALCAKFTMQSLPSIGRSFLRDHTTILHGALKARAHVEAVAAEMPDAPITELARALKRRLG